MTFALVQARSSIHTKAILSLRQLGAVLVTVLPSALSAAWAPRALARLLGRFVPVPTANLARTCAAAGSVRDPARVRRQQWTGSGKLYHGTLPTYAVAALARVATASHWIAGIWALCEADTLVYYSMARVLHDCQFPHSP